jgi:serine/threonine protein kinase
LVLQHPFAMKMFKLDNMSKEALEQTKREKDVLSHIRHVFLVQLFYAFVEQNKIFLCLELANGIKKKERMPHRSILDPFWMKAVPV